MTTRSAQAITLTPHRIFKYPVPIEDTFTIEMPEVCEILDVQVQHGEPVMWAFVAPYSPIVSRQFRLIGTGHPVDAEERYRLDHVGSFQMVEGSAVFHLFEVLQ